MADLMERPQAKLAQKLETSLDSAASIITKSYLDRLESLEIVAPSAQTLDIDVVQCGAFYHLTRLVVNQNESMLDKLTTIINVVFSTQSSLATIIHSDGNAISYYLGIVSKQFRTDHDMARKRRKGNADAFKGALSGNLVGSDLKELSETQMIELRESLLGEEQAHSVSAVSGLVSLRDEEHFSMESYVQGIENLVDSLQGKKYTILMIADPITTSEIQIIKRGYELLHTQLSSFRRSSLTVNENDTITLSKAQTEGITNGITTGISMTQGKTISDSVSTSKDFGIGLNVGIIGVAGISGHFGVTKTRGKGTATTDSQTNTSSELRQRNRAVTDTTASAKGIGRSLQLNYENRSIQALQDKIDKHLTRLDKCESFGAFNCAAYCLAETREDAMIVASNYNALMRGDNSNVQATRINTWHQPDKTERLLTYLRSLEHPKFCRKEEIGLPEKVAITPASIVSGNELAIQVGLPKQSVAGLTVVPIASFGRNMIPVEEESRLRLGTLYHMGRSEGDKRTVDLDVESLSMHTFVTGSTGSGKSTIVFSLLEKLMNRSVKDTAEEKVKFLVIEPAKGEYKTRFGHNPNVSVFGSNPLKTPMLKLNPFSFPADIHILEHIDRLIEIFNVCWPMFAAMPAVLKDAIERAYLVAGWDLEGSVCKFINSHGVPLYPTFSDVLHQINRVMEESQYSADGKADYKGALCTRIRSLTNGIYGQMFVSDEIPPEQLFDENVIIDLSRLGSSETKSLIMGLLVMKLQEYRMASVSRSNAPLRHVTVLEEAHHILKRTSLEQNMESANVTGKSVELLANSIAEMRTYGEGFIIADQSPGLMDLSVIRNTNTKIVLRLPDLEDRKLVGYAASLNEEQISELSRLPVFVAAVYQNNWLEPVLCQADTNFMNCSPYAYQPKPSERANDKVDYIRFLLTPIHEREQMEHAYLRTLADNVYLLPISAEGKTAFIHYLNAGTKEEIQRHRGTALFSLFQSEKALSLSRSWEHAPLSWYTHMIENLEPDISTFTNEERNKIIAALAKANADQTASLKAKRLWEHFMHVLP